MQKESLEMLSYQEVLPRTWLLKFLLSNSLIQNLQWGPGAGTGGTGGDYCALLTKRKKKKTSYKMGNTSKLSDHAKVLMNCKNASTLQALTALSEGPIKQC